VICGHFFEEIMQEQTNWEEVNRINPIIVDSNCMIDCDEDYTQCDNTCSGQSDEADCREGCESTKNRCIVNAIINDCSNDNTGERYVGISDHKNFHRTAYTYFSSNGIYMSRQGIDLDDVFIHEMGHTYIKLCDEYSHSAWTNKDDWLSSQNGWLSYLIKNDYPDGCPNAFPQECIDDNNLNNCPGNVVNDKDGNEIGTSIMGSYQGVNARAGFGNDDPVATGFNYILERLSLVDPELYEFNFVLSKDGKVTPISFKSRIGLLQEEPGDHSVILIDENGTVISQTSFMAIFLELGDEVLEIDEIPVTVNVLKKTAARKLRIIDENNLVLDEIKIVEGRLEKILDETLPDDAQLVTGFANVEEGAGTAPVIENLWTLPDESLDNGTQLEIIPSGERDDIYSCIVVSDVESRDSIIDVFVDVHHPDDSFKYQVHAERIDDTYVINCLDLGLENGFITSQQYDMIYYNIFNQPNWYMYKVYLPMYYHQPSGIYDVFAYATDSTSRISEAYTSNFEWLPGTYLELDFSTIEFGNIQPGAWKVLNGDLDMGTADMPTLKNEGNTEVRVGVEFTSFVGVDTLPNKIIDDFDAQLRNMGTDNYLEIPGEHLEFVAGEEVWFTHPISLCRQEKIDFSVHADIGTVPDNYQGEIVVFAIPVIVSSPPPEYDRDLRSNSAICTQDNQCASGICFYDNLCGLPWGEQCSHKEMCRSNLCIMDYEKGLICLGNQFYLQNGESCTADNQCAIGSCVVNICGLPSGESCISHDQCVNGACGPFEPVCS